MSIGSTNEPLWAWWREGGGGGGAIHYGYCRHYRQDVDRANKYNTHDPGRLRRFKHPLPQIGAEVHDLTKPFNA